MSIGIIQMIHKNGEMEETGELNGDQRCLGSRAGNVSDFPATGIGKFPKACLS